MYHLPLECERVIVESTETGHHLCFNIFKLCHCVQTLTETVSFQKRRDTGWPGSINRLPGNKAGPHVCTYTCNNHTSLQHIDV